MKINSAAQVAAALALLAAGAGRVPPALAAADETIVERNITNDLDVSSGEPEIAVDPTNPRHLAIIEFAVGSAKWPATSAAFLMSRDPAATVHDGRIMISTDGGMTWTEHPNPLSHPDKSFGADPAIAFGPDGALYAATVLGPKGGPGGDFSDFTVAIVSSQDGGATFSPPQLLDTAPHRPWLKVDATTGRVFLSTVGFLPSDKNREDPSKQNAWVVAFEPHLAARSEPRRIGGPDYATGSQHYMVAAHGVVAATFMLGFPPLESEHYVPGPVAIPPSLRSAVKDGRTSCSPDAPCLFLTTSSDAGRHWTARQAPLPSGGASGLFPMLAADPGRPGRYALAVVDKAETAVNVMVTDDSGETWSKPVRIPETLRGQITKPWMEYAPNGVLGMMWKKQRIDLPQVATKPLTGSDIQRVGQAFDVYAAISCDGGATWTSPRRLNAETNPAGVSGMDDMSYMGMDGGYAHIVWGDRRNVTKVKNTASGIAGVQAYYARAPFSAFTSTACGRK